MRVSEVWDQGMRRAGGTHGVRIIEIVLDDGVAMYIVDKTWFLWTNDEIT